MGTTQPDCQVSALCGGAVKELKKWACIPYKQSELVSMRKERREYSYISAVSSCLILARVFFIHQSALGLLRRGFLDANMGPL